MVPVKTNWIFLRGLARGTGHWGIFPERFQAANPDIKFELLEIPGNGSCADEKTPIDPKTLIDQIRNKSKFFSKSVPINICGVSLGGMIALKWAELYPNEIQSVVVINSSLSQLSPFYQRLMPGNYLKFLKSSLTLNVRLREKIILEMTSNDLIQSNKQLDSFTNYSKKYPFHFNNLIRQLKLATRININYPLKVPTKVIYSKMDRLVDSKCSIAISEMLGTQAVAHLTAGHDIALDDPDWLIARILEN